MYFTTSIYSNTLLLIKARLLFCLILYGSNMLKPEAYRSLYYHSYDYLLAIKKSDVCTKYILIAYQGEVLVLCD